MHWLSFYDSMLQDAEVHSRAHALYGQHIRQPGANKHRRCLRAVCCCKLEGAPKGLKVNISSPKDGLVHWSPQLGDL